MPSAILSKRRPSSQIITFTEFIAAFVAIRPLYC